MYYKSRKQICFVIFLLLNLIISVVNSDENEDHYIKGNLFFDSAKYQWAIEEYQKTLELQPGHEEAKIQLDKTIAIIGGIIPDPPPSKADDYYNKANIFFYAKRYQWTVDECQKALEIRSDHEKANMLLEEATARLNGTYIVEAVSCTTAQNSYVKISTAATGARFSMGTTGGDPSNNNDNNVDLTFYHHTCSSTSFTSVRIDNIDYIYGSSDGDFTTEPHVIGGTSIECIWKIGNISITQLISIVTSATTGNSDVAEIKYIIRNDDTQSHQVGLRVMLDTMLGSNDGAPIDIPNSTYVNYEREFDYANMPQYWTAVAGTVSNPIFKAQGTLIGGVATHPDRFVTAHWSGIRGTTWDYSISTSRYVTNDSAVGIWWNPTLINPGSSRTIVTYYGLGRFSPNPDALALDLTIPAIANVINGEYSPNPFQANLTIRHSNGLAMSGVTATISLPNGLSLRSGQNPSVNVGNISANGVGQATWEVCITGNVVDSTLTVGSSATSASPALNSSANKTIQIPPIVGTIDAINANGNIQDTFSLHETIYISGDGFAKPFSEGTYTFQYLDLNNNGQFDPGEPYWIIDNVNELNNRYNVYIVPFSISNGADLAAQSVSGINLLSTDANGNLTLTPIWYEAGTLGNFMLVVDGNRNGKYDNSPDKDATALFTVVTPPNPVVYTADASGQMTNQINKGSKVCAIGNNFTPGATADIYVVQNQYEWQAGDKLVDCSGGYERVTISNNGNIPNGAVVWNSADVGAYDIVVDQNINGLYDDSEPVDDIHLVGFTVTVPLPPGHREYELACEYNYYWEWQIHCSMLYQ